MAEPVPHGGGQYLVGRPYTVAGHRYVPAENPSYSAVGMASWYGAAFHGRRTANGEVYDMASLSAAHPTMPLPSYARVTNLGNGYSVIVRVNDRGPYHAGRVMDVSSRVADVLDMKAMGTAKVKVDYVGPAPMEGSDDSQLLASLRTDGSPANMIGFPSAPTMVAEAETQTQSIFSFFSGGGGRSGSAPAASSPRRRSRLRGVPPRRPSLSNRCALRRSLPRPWPSRPRTPRPRSKPRKPMRRCLPCACRAARFRCRRPARSISAPIAAARSSSPLSLRLHPLASSRRRAGRSFMRAPSARMSYSGPARLPPKRPTIGAVEHVKSAKSARADY